MYDLSDAINNNYARCDLRHLCHPIFSKSCIHHSCFNKINNNNNNENNNNNNKIIIIKIIIIIIITLIIIKIIIIMIIIIIILIIIVKRDIFVLLKELNKQNGDTSLS